MTFLLNSQAQGVSSKINNLHKHHGMGPMQQHRLHRLNASPVAVSSSLISGKKLLGKPKQYSNVKNFDMYACKIQNWKFCSVLTTACPADSRNAYCKVCNNSIINRFFAFNCCEKDRNNTENLSEWTSFGAVNTFRLKESTIPFKEHHVYHIPLLWSDEELQHQKRISLFFVKSVMQNYFHNVQVSCYCCATWYEAPTIFSFSYSHLR